jgi:hypothetical protein
MASPNLSRKRLNTYQIFLPIQRIPQRLKGVKTIAFAFLLDGRILKAPLRNMDPDRPLQIRRDQSFPLPKFFWAGGGIATLSDPNCLQFACKYPNDYIIMSP